MNGREVMRKSQINKRNRFSDSLCIDEDMWDQIRK